MIDKKLIEKFYKGECTEEEVKKVLYWFETEERGKKNIDSLWVTHEANSPVDHNSEKQLEKIHSRLNLRKPFNHFYLYRGNWIKIAAIIVFALLIPSLLFIKHDSENPALISAKEITKENPSGRKSTVRLPDGTIVNLNSESSITYAEYFTGAERKVSLTGEAFFEVAENPDKPFIVTANGLETKALGTSFNIKAFEEDSHVQVVLATGKVKVSSQTEGGSEEAAFLIPGDEVLFNKETFLLHKKKANLDDALGWKDNVLVFDNASAEEVFSLLQRWYGVTVAFTTPFPKDNWNFTGKFQNENLENVLISISYSKDFSYKLENKSLTITP